jgi:hypothetical protein
MNPHLIEMLSRQRAAELRRPAHRSGQSGLLARAGPGGVMRQRMGWTLVEIGLRLAATPAMAGRTSPGPAVRP